MQTEHECIVGDSRSLDTLDDESVELVVTSPPYPMIEMWDDVFAMLDDDVDVALHEGDPDAAFDCMHRVLAEVWEEVARVLKPGGVVCINIGDATRTFDNTFQLYPNHSRVTEWFVDHGDFTPLPSILWHKPTNKASKFMGSGMQPPNAYVTQEREHLLLFRKGGEPRTIDDSERRAHSAYFWEERNNWFSDIWMDISGDGQTLDNDVRDRAASYPFDLPYRIINMYSIQGDTVLDPFWGTGTTTLSAIASARNSIGVELESDLVLAFEDRLDHITDITEQKNTDRLTAHNEFVEETDTDPEYTASTYSVPVQTQQEKDILFYDVDDIAQVGERVYRVTHTEHTSDE